MTIATVFACISCSDISVSRPWYERLLGRAPVREGHPGVAEFQFTPSAEIRVSENTEGAGQSQLILGVIPLAPERERLEACGLSPSAIAETDGYFTMRVHDPDGNLVIFASAKRG